MTNKPSQSDIPVTPEMWKEDLYGDKFPGEQPPKKITGERELCDTPKTKER